MTLRTHLVPAARPLRRAFSLLELMIVVAIIIILVSLTLAVITPVLLKNEERVTRNVLSQLDAAVQQWETSVQRRVTYQNSTSAPDNSGVWDIAFSPTFPATPAAPFNGTNQTRFVRTSKLLDLIAQDSAAKEILAKIPAGNFGNVKRATAAANGDQMMDAKGVLDAWGTPIVAVFPGRDWSSSDPSSVLKDFDGTIRCSAEDGTTATTSGWGICRNRLVLFVSAGPDQSFVDVSSTTTVDERADNIYSYGQEGN